MTTLPSAPALDAPSEDAAARLAHLAYHDALTGLPNRTRVAERLAAALERAARRGGSVVLLGIDLDGFKLVNDGLGHPAGDELLRQVAARLDTVRRADDMLARYGGDEFLLLIEPAPGADASTIAAGVGARIAAVLEAPFLIAEAEFRIGASVGAAFHPADAADADTLHRHADSAMYAAKASGGGYAAYRPGPRDPLAHLSMAARLRRALHEGGFALHFQPIYRLPGRGLMGVEALLRWHDEAHGEISPEEFIPVAEKTGVIDALGDWVLDRLCRQAQAWDARGLHPNFGINVSPRQLLRPGFATEFAETVGAHGLDPRRFVLELTESAWTIDAGRSLPTLERLRAAGFRVALDDFGAGYSSLSRLRRLPVDVIKIDRSFMTDLPQDPQAAAVIDAIFALADACECDVVAEGVETQAQLEFVIGRGCRLAQGFGLGRPQSADAVSALLAAELVDERRTTT